MGHMLLGFLQMCSMSTYDRDNSAAALQGSDMCRLLSVVGTLLHGPCTVSAGTTG